MLCLQRRQFQHSGDRCCWELLFSSFGRDSPLGFFSNVVVLKTIFIFIFSFLSFYCSVTHLVIFLTPLCRVPSYLPILCGPFFAVADFHQDVSMQFLLFGWCLKSPISIQQAGYSMFIVNRAPEMLDAILREGK